MMGAVLSIVFTSNVQSSRVAILSVTVRVTVVVSFMMVPATGFCVYFVCAAFGDRQVCHRK